VTPRSPDPDHRGPGVFWYLHQEDTAGQGEKDALARALGEAIEAALSEGGGTRQG
jgi:hypothetical protein